MKKILLIGDLVGHEKIALSAMIPILSNMNCNVNNLLTAVVSNNFDYGITKVEDMTNYMRETNEIWKELDFKFDFIFVGYLNSLEQVKIIEDIIEFNDFPPVISDPIMGDDGVLYKGLTDEVIAFTKEMTDYSDIIIPNLTEAGILLDQKLPDTISEELVNDWLDTLSKGKKSVIITSVEIDGKHYVYGIDNFNKDNEKFSVEFELIPYKFAGTGDIFSSLVLGKIANGQCLQDSVQYACQKITEILREESASDSDVNSVEIEKYLDIL